MTENQPPAGPTPDEPADAPVLAGEPAASAAPDDVPAEADPGDAGAVAPPEAPGERSAGAEDELTADAGDQLDNADREGSTDALEREPSEQPGAGEPEPSEQPGAGDSEPSEQPEAGELERVGGVVGEQVDEDHLEPGQTEVPMGEEVVVDDVTMRRALEAILMVTDEPLPVLALARAVGRPTADVTGALGELAEEYTEQGRGFELREVGGGWRYYTRVDAAPYVERFVLDGQQARLTQAALETLAVVAYKQPVSRARISAIRGVNVDGVIRTLVARGLVEEAGSDTESQATLYRTSSYFLERMGMQSLDDLPELAPYLPEMDDIEEELAAQSEPEPQPAPDGDIQTGEPVEIDVTHDDDTPTPSEEIQPAEEPAEELEPGEPTGGDPEPSVEEELGERAVPVESAGGELEPVVGERDGG